MVSALDPITSSPPRQPYGTRVRSQDVVLGCRGSRCMSLSELQRVQTHKHYACMPTQQACPVALEIACFHAQPAAQQQQQSAQPTGHWGHWSKEEEE